MDRKATVTFRLSFIVATLLLCSGPTPAGAGEPTEQIRSAINQGVEILNGTKLDTEKGKTDAINRLREVVYPLFDFQEMARRSLGPHWRELDPQKQKEFVSLFTALLEKIYTQKIDLYDGQQVLYAGETVDKDYAEVLTKIISKKGESFAVNYKLRLVDGKWRVYDIVADNISVVNNYRSQFNRIIINSSFEELVKRLREKSI